MEVGGYMCWFRCIDIDISVNPPVRFVDLVRRLGYSIREVTLLRLER